MKPYETLPKTSRRWSMPPMPERPIEEVPVGLMRDENVRFKRNGDYCDSEMTLGMGGGEGLRRTEGNDPIEDFLARLPTRGITNALNLLPERQSFVLIARSGLNGQEPKTQKEIGKDLKVCDSRVSQIEMRARYRLMYTNRILDIIEGYVEPE